MFSKIKIYTLILIIFSATFNFSYADELSEVKTDINNMRVASEQPGILGGIFTKVFGTEGQIKNTFLSFITTTTNGYIPMWGNSQLVDSPLYSTTTGNIGIGTTNPSEKLEIDGALKVLGNSQTIGINNIANAWLKVGNSLGMDNNEIFFTTNAHFGTLGNYDLRIYTNGDARITLKGGGNIGINTPNPTEKLEVVGNIKASGNLTIGGNLNGDSISDNTIDSTEIEDNSLTVADLGTNSVGDDELIDNPTFSQITLNSAPTSPTDVATKEYVDNNGGGSSSINDLNDAKTTTNSMYIGIETTSVGYNNTSLGKNALTSIPSVNPSGGAIFGGGFGIIDSWSESSNNTAIGSSSLENNTIGYGNTSIGDNSMKNNTEGFRNTVIGSNALESNIEGNYNVAIGFKSLENNTTGDGNIAIGTKSMENNTTGWFNTVLGTGLDSNTTGYMNTDIGGGLNSNTTGYMNLSIGGGLNRNTTGYRNISIGKYTLMNNITGSNNIAIGNSAGYYETGSNKLYIDNSNTSSPLIYGDFATNKLTINGSLKVGVATDLTCDASNEGSIRFDSGDKNFYGCNGTIWEQLNN